MFAVLAVLCDFGIALALGLAALFIFDFSPLPHLSWLIYMISAAGLIPYLERQVFGKSLGEKIWSLSSSALASFLTFITYFSVLFGMQAAIFHHPLLAPMSEIHLPREIPDLRKSENEWIVLPFFFTLGSWPKSFQNQPIFYSLPYEKGPPSHFVGHVVAHWGGIKNPTLTWTAEGPKTPLQANRDEIRKCILASALDFHCAEVREKTIGRHLHEMHRIGPDHWKLAWFSNGDSAESAQGVMLEAESPNELEMRAILLNVTGRHQAFILRAPRNDEGLRAREIFRESVGSLRSLENLTEAQAFIDAELMHTQVTPQSGVSDLALIQARLISKISITPAVFDLYFHLAGTSLMLAQKAPEIALWIKPLVLSATRFARDVAPSDPRISALNQFELQASKL